MADNTQNEQLEKRAADAPEPDPIAESSMSGLLLVSSLLLVVTMVWALWDEVLGQRPWKGYQREFVSRYSDFLDRAKQRQGATEREIKGTPEYEQLAAAVEDASAEAKSKTDPIDAQVRKIDDKINAVTPPFQDVRSWI